MMDAISIKRIVIVGAGACGQQIALQFARFEFDVAVHDIDATCLDQCRARHREWLELMVGEKAARVADVPRILAQIRYEQEPARAAERADLLIESVPERRELKREVLSHFNTLCPPQTIFTTNTSYMLPSSLATASGRPERFAAFHFHVPVWIANAVDVMPHPRTAPWVVDALCALARRIDQTPIRLQRETPGYVFNTMLAPLLIYGLDLAARRIADFQDIDRAWMAVTKMKIGPFGIVDSIGLRTVHEILVQWGRWVHPQQAQRAAQLLEEYLAQDRWGEQSGQGFYQYPNPAFADPAFLRGQTPDLGFGSLTAETAATGEAVGLFEANDGRRP